MSSPYEEKVCAAIYYFASEHRKKTRSYLHQTFLYKYLAFFEFTSLKETGEMSLGLNYSAMKHGPVPDEIYKGGILQNTEFYKFQKEGKTVKIIPIQNSKINYDLFTRYENDLLSRLIEIFADKYIDSQLISDASHRDIKAWRKAWSLHPNGPMKSRDEFSDNLYEKPPEKLTLQEEHFILYSALKNCR